MSSATGEKNIVIGVDVGTGSARAGVFDLSGEMLATAVEAIKLFRPAADHVEHSSDDIWSAVCKAVKTAVEKSGVDRGSVCGISFDATCSLVALDENDLPVTVSTTGDDSQNVIVWMDHRAIKQADEINGTKHRVLDFVGGVMSPEQEPPKLKWIKENLPETWQRTAKFFDLADFLVYKASGSNSRSLCTVVCKWGYMGHEGESGGWDESFFEEIGLSDLLENDRAGEAFLPMGTNVGGLTAKAADELGLTTDVQVGVGIIDAHAGGLGSLGFSEQGENLTAAEMENTLALIGGTSSCHMAIAKDARFVPGVWGPYFGAMIPNMWLAEGGQSATGALVDHVIANHAYYPTLKSEADAAGETVYTLLNRKVDAMKTGGEMLTSNLHLLPDFLGNRSPRADSLAKGMISGLTLDSSFESMALLYYAAIQGVAYGTRHIIEALNEKGYDLKRIHACGGGTKNKLWLQEHADITGCEIYVAEDMESVLLGSAILAAVAAGKFDSIPSAMSSMSPKAVKISPNADTKDFHEAKYKVFKLMYEHQKEYKQLMKGDSKYKTSSE